MPDFEPPVLQSASDVQAPASPRNLGPLSGTSRGDVLERLALAKAAQFRAMAEAKEDGGMSAEADRYARPRRVAQFRASRAGEPVPDHPQGLPPQLRRNAEALSGIAMHDVRVSRDSSEPARIGALAFARGSEIHLGPGQEPHLPHEAWHVVQQKQGWVPTTTQAKGVPVNEDEGLEREAEAMGLKLLENRDGDSVALQSRVPNSNVAQRVWNPSQSASLPRFEHVYTWSGTNEHGGKQFVRVGPTLFRPLLEDQSAPSLDMDVLLQWSASENTLTKIHNLRGNGTELSEPIDLEEAKAKRERYLERQGKPPSGNRTLYGLQQELPFWISSERISEEIGYYSIDSSKNKKESIEAESANDGKSMSYGSRANRHTLHQYPLDFKSTNPGDWFTSDLYYLQEPPRYLRTKDDTDQIGSAVDPTKYRNGYVRYDHAPNGASGNTKVVKDTITCDRLEEWDPIGERSKKREVTQKQVMGNMSAANEMSQVAKAPKDVANGRDWHWCHLIAHSMGAMGDPQQPKNLVAGSAGVNGAMAHLELAIKKLARKFDIEVGLEVTAHLVGKTQVADKIDYKVDLKGGSVTFTFYPLSTDKSAVQLESVFAAKLLTALPKDTISKETASAYYRAIVDENKNPVRTPQKLPSSSFAQNNDPVPSMDSKMEEESKTTDASPSIAASDSTALSSTSSAREGIDKILSGEKKGEKRKTLMNKIESLLGQDVAYAAYNVGQKEYFAFQVAKRIKPELDHKDIMQNPPPKMATKAIEEKAKAFAQEHFGTS